jgi:hypothetical protein
LKNRKIKSGLCQPVKKNERFIPVPPIIYSNGYG